MVCLGATLGACAGAGARAAPSEQNFAELERGRYLTTAADCDACHTDPNDPRPFAGGRAIETPFGIVAAANITPDPDTGIGDWTEQQFEDAVRMGRLPDGSRLYPAMPYPYYTGMTPQDVQAIWTYLRTLEPVHHEVKTNRLPFPFDIRAGMRLWDALYFSPGAFVSNPEKSAEWNRGAYLVRAVGHCPACHTPKGRLGGDLDKQSLQGYALQGWFAPNITNDVKSGLGDWSVRDVVEYLKTGHNRLTAATGPMAEEVIHSSSRMSDEDLKAVAAYLKDQPGQPAPSSARSAQEPDMRAGAAIYSDLCAACHRQDGTGSAFLIPNLAGSSAVAARDPTSLLRIVIEGAKSAATADEPTAPAMPAYGWQLNDRQIAAVATYIRNSWGHAATATTLHDVQTARNDLRARRGGG